MAYQLLRGVIMSVKVPPRPAMQAMIELCVQQMVFRAHTSEQYDQHVSDLVTYIQQYAAMNKDKFMEQVEKLRKLSPAEIKERLQRQLDNADIQVRMVAVDDESEIPDTPKQTKH